MENRWDDLPLSRVDRGWWPQKGLVLMDRNVFEYLMSLNQKVEGAIDLLQLLAKYPELNNEDFIVYQAYFREYLADTNIMVIEALGESQQEIMLKANRERLAFEKKIRDPNDCYLDVMNRERELREQGEPSQLGYLFGMRRFTKRDILSDSFAEDEEDDSDLDEPSDANESQSENNGGPQ